MSRSTHDHATTDLPTPHQRLKINKRSTHPCITISWNHRAAHKLILLGGGQPC
jgi:hypothetical protein